MIKPALPIPASHLAKSPINVRKRTDPRADAELEASIAAHGLLQNLVGVPVSRKKGHYRVTAGGRRLDAIHRLIEKGRLRPDHEVPVLVLSNTKDGREISLVENFERAPLLGHVCRVSFDRKDESMVCLFQAARCAYPKSWRRAAWNKYLRDVCGIVPREIGVRRVHVTDALGSIGGAERAAHLSMGQNLSF